MAADELSKARFEKPTEILPFQLNTALKERVERNRHNNRWVIKVIVLCGKQCLPLRGHRESLFQEDQNPGNFLEILKLLSEANIELEQHLRNPLAKNVTYISPDIQNQIINIVGYDIIQKVCNVTYISPDIQHQIINIVGYDIIQNVTYISPDIQHQIINIVGYDIIQKVCNVTYISPDINIKKYVM